MARLNTYSNDTNPDRLDRLAGTASEDRETKNYLVGEVLSLTEISDIDNLQDILDLKADLVNGLVPASQLPSFVDDVIEVANYASLPAIGETGKIYVTLDDNKTYRWSGSTYIEIKDDHAVWGSISGTLSTQTDLQNALDAKGNLTGGNTWDGDQTFNANAINIKTLLPTQSYSLIRFYGSSDEYFGGVGVNFAGTSDASRGLWLVGDHNQGFWVSDADREIYYRDTFSNKRILYDNINHNFNITGSFTATSFIGDLVSTSNGDINITPDGTGKILLNSAMRINANVLDAGGNTPTVNDSVLVGDTNGQLTWKSKDDLNVVEGSGTFDTLAVWTNPELTPGYDTILGDSVITQHKPSELTKVNYVEIAPNAADSPSFVRFNSGGATEFGYRDINGSESVAIKLNDRGGGGYYTPDFRFLGNLAIGRPNTSAAWLDVGDNSTRQAARFYGGVIISSNPGGVQVDNTSMVIGSGDNDIVSGSDHCLTVGKNNQITNNSDQSVAVGTGNSVTGSINSCAIGNNNTLDGNNTLALGFGNNVSANAGFTAGGENIINGGSNNMLLGFGNRAGSNSNYILGNTLTNDNPFGAGGRLLLGYRNDETAYPAVDVVNGLSEVKVVIAAGAITNANANAILITAGGKNGSGNPSVPQIPRIILPQQETLEFTSDTEASAGGIPTGALYRSGSNLKINFNETAASGNEGLARLTPQLLTASATGSGSVSPDYNLVVLSWTGGNGNYTLNLPLASANTHRLIRITTDGTLSGGAGDKIDITATGGETIDGAASFQISKQYEGLAIFSTGTEWIIVQAKAH